MPPLAPSRASNPPPPCPPPACLALLPSTPRRFFLAADQGPFLLHAWPTLSIELHARFSIDPTILGLDDRNDLIWEQFRDAIKIVDEREFVKKNCFELLMRQVLFIGGRTRVLFTFQGKNSLIIWKNSRIHRYMREVESSHTAIVC